MQKVLHIRVVAGLRELQRPTAFALPGLLGANDPCFNGFLRRERSVICCGVAIPFAPATCIFRILGLCPSARPPPVWSLDSTPARNSPSCAWQLAIGNPAS